MGLKDARVGNVVWTKIPEDRNQCWAFVAAMLSLRIMSQFLNHSDKLHTLPTLS
jgi:hypothetical protein